MTWGTTDVHVPICVRQTYTHTYNMPEDEYSRLSACLECGKMTASFCPLCKKQGLAKAAFCSRECQANVWKTHKRMHAPTKPKPLGAAAASSNKSKKRIDLDDCCDPFSPASMPQEVAALSDKERSIYMVLKELLRRLKTDDVSKNDTKDKVISGAFEKLLDPVSFRELVFPGVTKEGFTSQQLPTTATELMQWNGMSELAERSLVKTAKAAKGVLDGARARGLKQGQVMDAMTEKMLMPQIAQESLGRSLVVLGKQVVAYSNQIKKYALREAKRENMLDVDWDAAPVDMLDATTISSLYETGRAHQDVFLGPEWNALVLTDLVRFAKDEELVPVPVAGTNAYEVQPVGDDRSTPCVVFNPNDHPDMTWIDDVSQMTNYPALQEAVRTLQFLPFELNTANALFVENNTFVERNTPLLEMGHGCVLVMHFHPGTKLDEGTHLESLLNMNMNTSSGVRGVGVQVACTYHLSASTGTLAELACPPRKATAKQNNNHKSVFAVANDMVVVRHPSACAALRAAATEEYFVLAAFVHGAAPKAII